ncbi:MAG: aminoacyl-tRNA deacylase [Anaerolineae bacterium]|nr:aminoacyl-tRNA deacylase [Anaerolineae bacterium]MDH7473691.1 aminoacyl-tRNA deacylase [Anaerolineae bacterium]
MSYINDTKVVIMVEKTNAMRVLDAHKVPYEIITFSPDIHSAEGVAEAVGISPAEVYKTLVVSREHGKPLLVMIAGDRELDLKRMARAVGEKKLKMATYRQAEELTGLQVGGISPLALLNRGFEVYIDRPATELSHVYVSAGRRGINLRVPVKDLIAITKAKVVEATGE